MQHTRVDRDGSVEEFHLPAETSNTRRSRQPSRVWQPTAARIEEQSTHDSEWRKVYLRLCSRTTWVAVLKLQAVVVRNAAGSVACAWIPNAFYALGDVFSGKWYTEQSRNELLVSNSVYAGIAFCTVVFTSFMPMLMSLQFADSPGRRPGIWFCVKRLVRATWGYFVVTLTIMFGFSCLIAYLDSIKPGLFKFKIECYADVLILFGYFTGISRAVKQIYYDETRQGRDRLQLTQQKSRKSRISPADVKATVQDAFKAPPRPRVPKFWRAYAKGLPSALIPFVAGLFVHVLSQTRIVDRGNVVLTGFVITGIAFKFGVQELAKHYIFKKRVRSARAMCVLVGIPTVLVDTQTRIILLGTNSKRTAEMSVFGMAFVKIILRASKAAFVMWEIRHRKTVRATESISSLQQQAILELFLRRAMTSIVPESPKVRRPPRATGLNDFELWRRQVQAFHTAEISADMYAEYISIGCAASIIFFYGNHPHYWLLRQSASAKTASVDVMAWRMSQLSMLGLQVGVEIIVDYVSVVLEMGIGIEFDHVRNLGSFLAALFMVAAVMNITISIGYYLS